VRRAGSPQLVWHGGSVMTGGAAVTSIFWGPSWSSATFAGGKVTGLDDFYAGIGGSTYADTTTEYTDSPTHHVTSTATSAGHLFVAAACSDRANADPDMQDAREKIVAITGAEAEFASWEVVAQNTTLR
jgi:hypothetical protein